MLNRKKGEGVALYFEGQKVIIAFADVTGDSIYLGLKASSLVRIERISDLELKIEEGMVFKEKKKWPGKNNKKGIPL